MSKKLLNCSKIINFILIVVSLSVFIGCSIGGKSSPSHFYMLGPQIENTNNQNINEISMGVGPIVIPGYIDRPQIVTKTETAELHLSEFDRWAEPMGSMFTRTLAHNIKILTGSHQIHSHPWPPRSEFQYQITANVMNFENNENGDALLIVHWKLINKNEDSEIQTILSEYRASANNSGYAARVAALNDTLAQFAQEIVGHLN